MARSITTNHPMRRTRSALWWMRYALLPAGVSSGTLPRELRLKIGTTYRLRITGATRRKAASFRPQNPILRSTPAHKGLLQTAAGEGWGGTPAPAGGRPQAVQRRFTHREIFSKAWQLARPPHCSRSCGGISALDGMERPPAGAGDPPHPLPAAQKPRG